MLLSCKFCYRVGHVANEASVVVVARANKEQTKQNALSLSEPFFVCRAMARRVWRAVVESAAAERVVDMLFVAQARACLFGCERRALSNCCCFWSRSLSFLLIRQTQMAHGKSSHIVIDRKMLTAGVIVIFVALAFVNSIALNVSVALQQGLAFSSSRCVLNEFSSLVDTVTIL